MKITKTFPLLGMLGITLMFGLTGPFVALAATTPLLNAAATYSILSSTYTDTSAGTNITGDVGFTTPPAAAPGGVHANYGSGAPYATAGVDQGNALSALALESCTFTFAPGAIDLSTDVTHGPVGIYSPGVYCSTGAMDISGPLNLNGSGTYIFRPVGALNSTAGSVVTLTGSSACDIFWTPSAATTLAANTTFIGTIIDDAAITVGANTTWTGRALSFGGTVTTDTDTINAPICAPAPIIPVPVVAASVSSGSTSHGRSRAITPPEILGAYIEPQFAFVPSLPNAGAGGEAANNISLLLGSMTLVATGILLARKTILVKA